MLHGDRLFSEEVIMSIKRIFIALPLMAAAFLPNFSYAETLKESVGLALAAHPSIETAVAQKKISEEDKAEARSGYFPELSANATAGRIYADNSTSRGLTVTRGAAYSWYGEGNAAITQPIFDAFETSNRVNAAQARILSAELNVSDVRESLTFQAVQAHIAVAQAKDILNKINDYRKIIEDYSNRIQVMVDDGVADKAELAQAKNISLALKSAAMDYEGQLETSYANYREVVGQMPTSAISKPAAISLMDGNVEAAIERAKSEHPLILSSQKEIEAAKYDIKAEKAGYYPDIDGELSYLQRDQREEIGGEAEDARAVIKMSWAFETGGGQSARTRRTKAQYAEAIARNHENVRSVEGEIRRAYAEYETAQKQLSLIKKRESAAEELLAAYKVQFEGAVVRLLQIMQAENQLFNTQLEAITADYRNILSHYLIWGSMGNINKAINSSMVASPASEAKIIREIPSDNLVEAGPVIPKISQETEEPDIAETPVVSDNLDMPVESESQEIISSGSDVLQPAEQIPADMAMGEKSPVSVPRVSKRIEVEQHNTQEERYPQKAIEDGAVTKKVSKDIDVQFYTTESMQDNHAEMENDLSVIDKTSERVYIDSE
jgi:adhesin transport system outer membrane protein